VSNSGQAGRFVSERLGPRHDLRHFACGSFVLNRWLRRAAIATDSLGLTRTFVWARDAKVVAYFTLAPHRVRVAEGEARKLPPLPAVLLARLALDVDLQGRGLGAQLLVDAVERAAVGLAGAVGAQKFAEVPSAKERPAGVAPTRSMPPGAVVVDALDGAAASFYSHFGFRPVPGDAYRLYLSLAEVAVSLS
jgi:predicted N-acetyltransferase YhbS